MFIMTNKEPIGRLFLGHFQIGNLLEILKNLIFLVNHKLIF